MYAPKYCSITREVSIPAIELTDQLPDLSMLLKGYDTSIAERMVLARDNKERVAIITRFFEEMQGHDDHNGGTTITT